MKVFIGSSNAEEAKNVMQTVAETLEESSINVEPIKWSDSDVFIAGCSVLENLERIKMEVDAAIFIYAEDDLLFDEAMLVFKGSPRDNILFEHGLFSGYLGGKKSIIIRYKEPKTPTDLKGIIRIDYKDIGKNTLKAKLSSWIKSIENNMHPRQKESLANEALSAYNEITKDLENLFTRIQDNNNVFTKYIEGEEKAFTELTEAIKSAEKSIRTTRFSQYTVKGKGNTNDFFQAICEVMKKKKNCPEYFHRIITTNRLEKLEEILELIIANKGLDFNIHLSKEEFNFEIVIIDDKTVFIHFRKNIGKQENYENGNLVSATLKFTYPNVAEKFIEIFESIKEKAFFSINCKDINADNIGEEITKIKKLFSENLQEA